MNGLPSMSTFRKSAPAAEPKRSYVRAATALATKSVPPPLPAASQSMPGLVVEPRKASEPSTTTTPSPSPTPPPIATNTTTTTAIPEAPLSKLIVPPSLQKPQDTSRMSLAAKRRLSDRLNENPATARPNLSFAALIVQALQALPGKSGTLQMIYRQMMDTYPYFRLCDKFQWQNSIRHNLSLQKAFVRSDKKDGKGCFWSITPGFNTDDLFGRKPYKTDDSGERRMSGPGRPKKDPRIQVRNLQVARSFFV